jgi:hypothetical protein
MQNPAVAGFHALPVLVQEFSLFNELELHEPDVHLKLVPDPSHFSFVSPATLPPCEFVHLESAWFTFGM